MKLKFQNTELSWPKDRSSHNFDIILIEKHKSVEILHSNDDILLHVTLRLGNWLYWTNGMKWNI